MNDIKMNDNKIIKKKILIKKYFRLFDFHTFNEIQINEEETEETENINKDDKNFVIQMFGVNEKGETCSIYVKDFQPFFFILIDKKWTHGNLILLINEIKSKIGKKYAESITDFKIVEYKKMYGFTAEDKDKFAKLTFKNTEVMNRVKNLWYSYKENNERKKIGYKFLNFHLELYESGNIPPLLRFFHIHEISPSGWISFYVNKVIRPNEFTTTCTYEYICPLKEIKPEPTKLDRVPFKICSFDIEASSSHGDFPIPIKTYKRLATNILDTFQKQPAITNNINSANKMLEKCILSAFSFGKTEGIDIVYPKQEAIKENIKKRIDILLKESIENAKNANKEEDNSNLLKIDDLFECMNEKQNQSNIEMESSENIISVENENFNEDENNIDSDNDDNDEKVSKNKITKTIKKTNNKETIINILLDKELKRNEKIQILNDVLTRLFPRLEGDKVTFIGSTFLKYGDSEPYLNHCIVLNSCDPVENTEIITTKTEKSLLLKWSELIQKENPDIIIGYNIFGFDYEFLFRRAQENDCINDFMLLSRKKEELSIKKNSSGEIDIESTKLAIASGEYDLRYFKMTGRLQIDLYASLRRDFIMSSYKLDDVAGQFICDSIKKSEHIVHEQWGDVTELYTQNLMGIHINDYIHIELSGYTTEYHKRGEKFKILDIYKNKEVIENVKGIEKTVVYNVLVIQGHESFDNTKSIKWGIAKDDVSPKDIFRLANGSSSDRAIVAKYCIQDCNLVHHLMNKIDIITGHSEMANICCVPISFLVFRGQGIKLTSFVAKKCMENGMLMPDLEKSYTESYYEGALVLPPKCAMYIDRPVACVDYSSLYPSAMISQNYSHDSLVWVKEYNLDNILIKEEGQKNNKGEYEYDNLSNYEYIDIEYDNFKYLRTPGKECSVAKKVKIGKIVCRWAQLPNDKKSILPSILQELLKARSDTRKLIKTEKDPFMQNILDKRQLAYKVTANSLYGQCGSRTSSFYQKNIAASTTATGRQMITYAKRIIEEVYGDSICNTTLMGPVLTKAEYVYGDSVADYTPVYIRFNNIIDICTIESLAEKYGQHEWKQCSEEGKQEKEFCEMKEGVESWSDKGWTKLYRVIRHKLAPHKKMVRILTHTGLVDVTDDHSLLLIDGSEISPKDCNVGMELLHNKIPMEQYNNINNITESQAKVMGFFFGDGSCGNYICPSGNKSSWALNNASLDFINKYLNLCEEAYPEFDWCIMDTMESSNVYKISPRCNIYGSIANFVKNYRNKMYYQNSKIIPNEILFGNENIRKAFWEGMYDADGDKDENGYIRIDQKNQISASNIQLLASSLGWKTSINSRSDKQNIYRITMTKKTQRKNPIAIKKINNIDYDGYVYDLTTENHHFAAGVGDIIVHNTDSVFFTFNLRNAETDEKIVGKPALEITIELAKEAAKLCSQWLKSPMELAYEKTLMPFILLSKKRYVGMLYEDDPNKGKLKYMGLPLKRRDSCDLMKDIYGGVLDILMKSKDTSLVIQYLNQQLENLISGNIPIEKLMITKALRSDYKNPESIGHNVLAERIGQRDPGNKPKSGDRIKFVFIVNNDKKALQGHRMETPEYIIENNIKIDYIHYITNQILKPIQQLIGLDIENILITINENRTAKEYVKQIKKLQDEYPDLEIFMKKREKIASAEVKKLIFDKILQKVYNEQNGIRTMNDFFIKK
jgi:DNA polymerase elongation subunit (family B)